MNRALFAVAITLGTFAGGDPNRQASRGRANGGLFRYEF